MTDGEVLLERLIKYCNSILCGELVACEANKWACQRFLDDLSKSKTNDWPYFFDTEELDRINTWASMFKHTKGVLKGQYIELVDVLLFELGNLLGWKKKKNRYRRFKKGYIQKARKNVKTQLMAILSSYITFLGDGEENECYIGGWDREQSSKCYKEILTQLGGCEMLKGKYTTSYGHITHKRSGSIIQPLSREAKNTGDGSNPTLGIIDEYHCHKTSEIYDVVYSGMVARAEPLMVIITTPGFDLDVPCHKEYEYCKNLLNPFNPIENDEYFVMICELEEDDDIKDESCWGKANPVVVTYEEGLENLRTAVKTAMDKPEDYRKVVTKSFGKWVQMKEGGYMNLSKWAQAKREYTLEKFKGQFCNVGVDLSAKLDLTSVGFEIKIIEKGIPCYYTFSHSFMPEETYKSRMKEGKIKFDLWRDNGWLTVTPGAVVDYDFVKKYIKDTESEFELTIKDIGYDPWNASQFANDMSADGYNMVEIRQGIKTLGEPIKSFREEVYKENLYHNDNPVLTWACGNAVTKQDANGNFLLDKSKSGDKIDPLAALINAHVLTIDVEVNNYDVNAEVDDFLAMAIKMKSLKGGEK